MTLPKKIGKYQIVSEIGRGGFATVYHARDTQINRDVALKVITAHTGIDANSAMRFYQEVVSAANLRHPNLVPVYDFGNDDNRLFLAMALIKGHSLKDILNHRKRFSLTQALPILKQLAEGLDYLHNQQLVHRDLKPANVLLEGEEDNWQVVLVDFGLVRSTEVNMQLTVTGSIIGTPTYMAPEQADPEQWGEISPLTDIYALGIIAYEMLVGSPPFSGESNLSLLRAHAEKDPPPPTKLFSEINPDLNDILLRALAKPQQKRYPKASTLINNLQAVANKQQQKTVKEIELSQLLQGANIAKEKKDWLTVQQFCVQMLQLNRNHPQALILIAEATAGLQEGHKIEIAHQQLLKQYEKGEAALSAGNWQQAVYAFEAVASKNPNFKQVEQKLTWAKIELQRATWYTEAMEQTQAKEWTEACQTWLNLLQQQLNYKDGTAATQFLSAVQGLLTHQQQLTQQLQQTQFSLNQTRKALTLYDALARAVKQADWVLVAETGQLLIQLVPHLEQASEWLTEANQRLAAVQNQAEGIGDSQIWAKDSQEMVRIPSGLFLYGPDKQRERIAEFWIDKTPITNKTFARFIQETHYITTAEREGESYAWTGLQWDWVKGANWKHPNGPHTTITHKMDHPVVQISRYDAVAYTQWAGKRLPTEQEWEKAARGNEGWIYPWGDNPPTEDLCNFDKFVGDTTPVGKYSPQGNSLYGCIDMSGNVWEWTASDYSGSNKVLRGGSWYTDEQSVQATRAYFNHPGSRSSNIGFRCVISIDNLTG